MRWLFAPSEDRSSSGWMESLSSKPMAKVMRWSGIGLRSMPALTRSSSLTTSAMRPASSNGSGSLRAVPSRSFHRPCSHLRQARASIPCCLSTFSARANLNLSINPRSRRRDRCDRENPSSGMWRANDEPREDLPPEIVVEGFFLPSRIEAAYGGNGIRHLRQEVAHDRPCVLERQILADVPGILEVNGIRVELHR